MNPFRGTLAIVSVFISALATTALDVLPFWLRLISTLLIGAAAGGVVAWFAQGERASGAAKERARWVEREAKVVNMAEWLARTMKPGTRQ